MYVSYPQRVQKKKLYPHYRFKERAKEYLDYCHLIVMCEEVGEKFHFFSAFLMAEKKWVPG